MALVRACEPALEPRTDPFRVRPPAFLLPLARARQRARDARGGPARARRARAARARRVADGTRARADPHRRRHLPQPRRAGRRRRPRRDRRALHVRQRLLRHRRQPPLRRPRQAGAVAGLHLQGPDPDRRQRLVRRQRRDHERRHDRRALRDRRQLSRDDRPAALLDRPPTTSTSTAWPGWSGSSPTLDGAVVVSHDREFLDRTITSVFELDDAHTAGRTRAGGAPTSSRGRSPRATPRRPTTTGRASANSSPTGPARQRQWGMDAKAKARKGATDGESTSSTARPSARRSRRRRSGHREGPRAARLARPTSRGGAGSSSFTSAAPRAGDVVVAARRRGRGSGPVPARTPSTSTWAGATRAVIAGPTAAARRRCSPRCSAACPPPRAAPSVGPSVVVGELDQARARFETDQPLLDRVRGRAPGSTAPRPARCSPSSGSAPTRSTARRRRCRPASAPGPLAGGLAARVNLLVLDEPTNHLDLEAIEQLEQALDTYDGTLLLVTHDRRLLEGVELTARSRSAPPCASPWTA